ncbi:unnamed protein product [Parnassius apollo]|uniref:(apollo) hypothetical protein n=1 Tax=Parnassius apollo TaxID=110799 RepID=A0A8S3XCY5_PARAO|nr:unnamed protein product [Parnassius apollo]
MGNSVIYIQHGGKEVSKKSDSKTLEIIVNNLDKLSDLSDYDDEDDPLYGDNVSSPSDSYQFLSRENLIERRLEEIFRIDSGDEINIKDGEATGQTEEALLKVLECNPSTSTHTTVSNNLIPCDNHQPTKRLCQNSSGQIQSSSLSEDHIDQLTSTQRSCSAATLSSFIEMQMQQPINRDPLTFTRPCSTTPSSDIQEPIDESLFNTTQRRSTSPSSFTEEQINHSLKLVISRDLLISTQRSRSASLSSFAVDQNLSQTEEDPVIASQSALMDVD